MRQRAFEEQRAARWAEFEAQVAALEASPRRRHVAEGGAELASLPERYRAICRDLAVATGRHYSPGLVDRLNRLALDGHRVLYAHDTSIARRVGRFFAWELPRAVRRDGVAVAIATLLFVGSGVAVGALVGAHPELLYSIMDAGSVRDFEAMYDPSSETVGVDRGASTDLQMFGFYVMNNIGIAFRAYAGGLLLGLGSALVLLFNGVQLGAVAAHIGRLGYEETFYAFVIGHGAFELTAIVLSGAAGLRLGWSIVAPGARTRLASLQRAAAESVTVVWGVFAMLLVAAVIEAFWSSKGSLPPELKLVVGSACWVFVIAYLGLVGRQPGRGDA